MFGAGGDGYLSCTVLCAAHPKKHRGLLGGSSKKTRGVDEFIDSFFLFVLTFIEMVREKRTVI